MGYSFQNEYILLPQTPLIHFQHDTPGATLRASGVKPELDEFLTRKAKQEGGFDESWLVKEKTDALNYKLRFRAMEEGEVVELGRGTPYDIYYGNMGDEQVKGVFRKTKMEVICFIPELMELIDRYIAEFFIVKNFGRMRGKGFGSFIVSTNEKIREGSIAAYLTKEYGAKSCYTFSVRPNETDTIFRKIKTLYSIMKSGTNLWIKDKYTGKFKPISSAYHRSMLFEYMHDKHQMGNEKAWLKQKKIAPSIQDPSRPLKTQHDTSNYYVRALLGVGDHIDFLNDLHDRSKYNKTTVTISSTEIERFPSPVFFKVIGNTVYYVAGRIDDSIYGKTFTFESPKGSGKCCVPHKEDIGEDFLDKFLEDCLPKLNKAAQSRNFRDLQNVQIRRI